MNGRPTSRDIQLRWWLRKRVDSPRPDLASRHAQQLPWGTFPGTPIQIGRSVPRRRTSAIQAAMIEASKQSWLTMWVAIGAFANIARIVSSSLIRWWLSG